ncbi:MAG TPA: HAMP domain-containing sensor histidine kinase [Candidatus Binatus sp.]|nr:HAMP domain-containing sensor histidine kinase [Candidatus Binatus sp.]
MGLAAKTFLATSLVMLALVAIAAWGVRAVSQLVGVNQAIITRSIPALRLETSLRESMGSLMRLEARGAVLRDARYEALWDARAERTARDLDRLRDLLATREERKYHRKARASLAAYRELAPAERGAAAPGGRGTASRGAAARAETAFERLTEATYAALEDARDDARRLELRTWRAVFTALPAAVLAGLAAAGLLAFGMTRSLRRLSVAAGEIAQGVFPGAVQVRGADEIGELARAFNHMAERLGEIDRLKEEFFADISHELRTPLTAVREATNLLQDEVPGPLAPKQARLVEIVGASTDRVLGLVNRILDLSRLKADLLAFDCRSVDLDRVVARALDELRPRAEARGLLLERNGDRPAGAVRGDEERLLQVLVNLVGNAIKFTPPGGAVRVHSVDRGEEVEITVEDTGAGIPADALPHVFDRYWQAAGARGGSGLGLAIVKSIVQAHGGGVRAESREGAGSRFSVRLPRGGAAA